VPIAIDKMTTDDNDRITVLNAYLRGPHGSLGSPLIWVKPGFPQGAQAIEPLSVARLHPNFAFGTEAEPSALLIRGYR
jgi:hypothetical protein